MRRFIAKAIPVFWALVVVTMLLSVMLSIPGGWILLAAGAAALVVDSIVWSMENCD